MSCKVIILLTKTTAAQNEDALSYHRVRGLCFLAVVSVATIVILFQVLEDSYNLFQFSRELSELDAYMSCKVTAVNSSCTVTAVNSSDQGTDYEHVQVISK